MEYYPEHGFAETLANMKYAYGFEGGAPSGESGIPVSSLTGDGGMPASPDTYWDRLNRFSNNEIKMSQEDFDLYQKVLAVQLGEDGMAVPTQTGAESIVFNSQSGESGMANNYNLNVGFQEGGQDL